MERWEGPQRHAERERWKWQKGDGCRTHQRIKEVSFLSLWKPGAVAIGGEVREGPEHRALTSSTCPWSPGGCSTGKTPGAEWWNTQAAKVTVKSSQEGISLKHGDSWPVSHSFDTTSSSVPWSCHQFCQIRAYSRTAGVRGLRTGWWFSCWLALKQLVNSGIDIKHNNFGNGYILIYQT